HRSSWIVIARAIPNKESSSTGRFTDTHILRARVEPSTAFPCPPFAFSSSRTAGTCHPERSEGSAFGARGKDIVFLSSLPPIPSSYTIIRREDPHATRHAIPPRPGHLRLSPRSPQNRPRRRRETLRRLRQHRYRTCGIAVHLEGQTGTFPRTPAPHQDHRQAAKSSRKGSPPPPLLQHSRISSSAHHRWLLGIFQLAPEGAEMTKEIEGPLLFALFFGTIAIISWQAAKGKPRRWGRGT